MPIYNSMMELILCLIGIKLGNSLSQYSLCIRELFYSSNQTLTPNLRENTAWAS